MSSVVRALERVDQVATEQRAMSVTDSSGGFLVPWVKDPAVQTSSAGSINPLRQISRVVQTTTDVWQGITSDGATAELPAEASQAADASPTVESPAIPNFKASAYVPYSYEVDGDAPDFLSELTKLVVDSFDQLTASAFTTGSGSGQPTGIITALAGGSSVVTPTTPESLTAPDVVKVRNALPARFRPNASWVANSGVLNQIRFLETTSGSLRHPELAMNPPMLLGRNVFTRTRTWTVPTTPRLPRRTTSSCLETTASS